MRFKNLKFIFATFLLWQILIASIIFFGQKYIPSTHQYTYAEREKIVNPKFLWNRANFDGMHYLDIARRGYGIYQQAFFPLYPSLIRKLTPILGGRDLLAALFVSWISHFLALIFLYKLIALDFREKIAKRSILYLLVFPTAFFFSMVYSESLFLFLVLASFYFARTKKWWLAGISGGLASATRLPGIFLFPALIVEWWEQRERRNNNLTIEQLRNLVALFLVPLGLVFYMRFLTIHFHDPLMFFHVQPFFGAGRTGGKIILLYQVFWRYLKMLWTVQKNSLTYFVVVLEFLTGIGFLGLLILSYLKKIRLSYLVFAGLAYLAPTLTGTFSSLPRYVLTLFPCFILLGMIENRIIRSTLYSLFSIFLIICVILFTRGYWIS